MNTDHKPNLKRTAENGVTRVDLLALVVGVLMLAGWVVFSMSGERGRTSACRANLKLLNRLMQEYANDHGGSLPPASIQKPFLGWDAQLAGYLTEGQVKQGIDPLFRCPSDQVERNRPRSYAMSAHDMRRENWPPGPQNKTGVGLVWNDNTLKELGERPGSPTSPSEGKERVEALALVKLSWLPAPAETLLLTELPHRGNNLKRLEWAGTTTPGEQLESLEGRRIHGGRFHYLMADGHVELLSPLQTGSSGGFDVGERRGIWTIKAGD